MRYVVIRTNKSLGMGRKNDKRAEQAFFSNVHLVQYFSMRLLIFGATGLVGQRLVRESLYMGHTVTAYARDVFTTEFPPHEELHLVEGTVFDDKALKKAMVEQDAVLSALGGGTDGTDYTRSLGIKHITDQMKSAGIQRIIAVGGSGILDDENGKPLFQDEHYPPEYWPVANEHDKALQYLMKSGLDWTMVCPPYIVDQDPTGAYTHSASIAPEVEQPQISNGDLALFMLQELTRNQYIHQRVGIATT